MGYKLHIFYYNNKIDIDLISTLDQAICYQLYICIILNTYSNSMESILLFHFMSEDCKAWWHSFVQLHPRVKWQSHALIPGLFNLKVFTSLLVLSFFLNFLYAYLYRLQRIVCICVFLSNMRSVLHLSFVSITIAVLLPKYWSRKENLQLIMMGRLISSFRNWISSVPLMSFYLPLSTAGETTIL